MLYAFPLLDDHDHAVVAAIDDYRSRLRYFLNEPRRWKGQIRRNLRARAMRGSNSIEGYDVSLDDAIALLEHDDEVLDADQRTVLEVTGYRNAMTYVQQLSDDPDFHFDQSLIRGLHFMMLGHDLSKSPGSYRRGAIYVRDDETEQIVYEGPDFEAVPILMPELLHELDHLDDNSAEQPIYVTAAMAHLNLVMIHPFRDGNGRMARCLQTLILARNQILSSEFSSIEEWLGRNTQSYYDILARTGEGAWNPQNDTTAWVRFNLRAHYMQAQTVWSRVREAEELWRRLEALISDAGLHPRTVEAMFNAALGLRVRRTAYQEDADIEAATANRDLKALVQAGWLLQRGETRGRYYLGTAALREIYLDVRRELREALVDPYGVSADELGPRRKLSTAT